MKAQWLVLLGVLAGPVSAATEAPMPRIAGEGEGRWSLKCEVLADEGVKIVLLDKAYPAYENRRLRRAACTYAVNSKTPTTISVSGADQCPFPGSSEGTCNLVAEPGARGSFKFTLPRTR